MCTGNPVILGQFQVGVDFLLFVVQSDSLSANFLGKLLGMGMRMKI